MLVVGVDFSPKPWDVASSSMHWLCECTMLTIYSCSVFNSYSVFNSCSVAHTSVVHGRSRSIVSGNLSPTGLPPSEVIPL